MKCPNCGHALEDAVTGHADGCALSMLLGVLEDRECIGVAEADLGTIDINYLWDAFLGPAANYVEDNLGLKRTE